MVSTAWLAFLWFRTTTQYVALSSAISSVYVYFSRPEADSVPVEKLQLLGQPFATALTSLYLHEPQLGTDGVPHRPALGDGIKISEGLFMFDLARRVQARKTMEVGLASGYSAVFFLAAVHANGGGTHVAMDPFENSAYAGVALQKVKQIGMERNFRFLEEFSYIAIPQLARKGEKFDVIFIDGNHRFDDVFVDFTLADQVCAPGGYILLHDRWMPSIQRAVSFISRNRADYRAEFFPDIPNIAVFRRVGQDKRAWNHYVPF
jgi:predicted O-methyltransferase YrrM